MNGKFGDINSMLYFCISKCCEILRNNILNLINLTIMKRILPILCMCMCALTAFAQQRITGVVMASDEPDPVIGASVQVKGTTIGTITDFDGNFELQAKPGDVLVFSYMGYKSQEVPASSSPMRITLEPDNVQLQEVVAIGYGTMKKSDLTGSVTSVDADQLLKAPVSGIDQALQGRAAGVTVTSGSGQPGEGATIRIRGIGSALGGNDPLYVVDGVITGDIKWLSPNDIKSMEILKDASAAAIYGSRGANGVILITTKSGGDGKANISFDAYWGFQNRWKKLDLMGAKEMADTKLKIGTMRDGAAEIAYYKKNGFNEWMSVYNTGTSKYFPTVMTMATPDGLDYSAIDTDWQDEVFNRNAFMHNYNLSVDGGGEKGHYAFSASYFGQEGTIIGSDYQRLTLRLNSDVKLFKWLTVGEHLSFVNSSGRNAMNNSSSPGASVISAALAMAPWDPTYYPKGSTNAAGDDLSGRTAASSNFKNVVNPFSMVNESFPQDKTQRWVGDVYLSIEPVKGLTIRPSISMDTYLTRHRLFKNQYEYSTYDKMNKNFLEKSMSYYMSLLEETTITYAKEIGKHNFSVMVGQTWQEINSNGLSGSGAAILNPVEENWYLGNTTEDNNNPTGESVSRQRRLSFLGRAFYNYDNRYMLTVNFRADASSSFTKQPWGFFPSASLAWRISQEPFFRDRDLTWLDNLKVRAGYGRVGNEAVGSGAFVQTIFSSPNVFVGYPFGNPQVVAQGAGVLTLVNPAGGWETNEQWDAGIDFGFWNGMLSGTIDYFRRNTLDALLYVTAPAHVGNRYSPVNNVGNIRNEGVEISLNHDNRVNSNFSYNIGVNLSYIHNELTALNGGSPIWGDRTKTDLGMPLNSFWGYEYEGVYKSDEEVLEQFYQYKNNDEANLHAGDARYKDLDGDGLLTENDKKNIGNNFPKLTYGLTFGAEFYGVDVQLFFQGVYGNKIYNALRLRTEGAGTECAFSTSMRDAWIGYTDAVRQQLLARGIDYYDLENRDGTIPNPVGSTLNSENSTRFLESGSYLRLKNVQIGYTLPQNITTKFHCSRLRFYVTASNLFTITKYSGYDPEVGSGVDYGNYPQSRTFTFGLNANF